MNEPVMNESVIAPDDLVAATDPGRAPLDEALVALRSGTSEAANAFVSAAHESVGEPLRAALGEAHTAHQRLAEALPQTPSLQDLRQYRRAIANEALPALRKRVADIAPAGTLGRLAVSALDAASAPLEALPAALVIPEPEGLLDAHPDDSFLVGLRRSGLRLRRRLFGGRTGERTHRVTVAEIGEALVTKTWGAWLSDAHAAAQRSAAARIATVEAAASVWTHGLLRLEAEVGAMVEEQAEAEEVEIEDIEQEPLTELDEGEPLPVPDGPVDPVTLAPVLIAETVPPPPSPAERLHRLVQTFGEALGQAHALDASPVALPDQGALGRALDRAVLASEALALPSPTESVPPLARESLRKRAAAWAGWHRQAHSRLLFETSLHALYDRLDSEAEALIARIREEGLEPVHTVVRDTQAELDALKEEAARICADETSCTPKALEDLRRRADRVLHEHLIRPLQQARLESATERLMHFDAKTREEAFASFPERMTLHPPPKSPPQSPSVPTFEVALRSLVMEATGTLFADQLQSAIQPLHQPFVGIVNEAEAVEQVVAFGIEAALDERLNPSDDPETDAALDALPAVRELTVDGLSRASERLGALPDVLERSWETVRSDLDHLFDRVWRELHPRFEAADHGTGQFLDLQADLRQRGRASWAAIQRGTAEAMQAAKRLLRRGQREATRLITKGRSAAGLVAEDERQRLTTLDALAGVDALRAALPLVYRRLFAFDPVSDPLLLEQRETVTGIVRDSYARWKNGQGANALMLSGPPGSGLTSLLQSLVRTLFEEEEPIMVALPSRIMEEAVFARLMASRLGIALPEDEATLDALERILRDEDVRAICLVDNLEHLLLRAVGGSHLVERVAVFFSRTDDRILWVTTMVQGALHFLERTQPQITGLATSVPLALLDKAGMEAAIMKRHTRSGLPITFEEPDDLLPLTRRKLSNAETEAERQAILREVFFDRLYRASGGHLQLAFLHWLRAADFQVASDQLTIHPLVPLNFSFLERIDLPRSFSLKALLQHGTLTLAEHNRVLRTSREQSFLIFEALANQLLIERVIVEENREGQQQRRVSSAPIDAIRDGDRYRIRPLAVNPVIEALRARNML